MTEPSDAHHDNLLIDRAAAGDEAALAELFGRYRKRLRAMVRLRMDRRLQGRVDPSDVLQEAYFDVAQQLPSYCANPEMLFYLWLRLTTGQRLMRLHRQHHLPRRPVRAVRTAHPLSGAVSSRHSPDVMEECGAPSVPFWAPRSWISLRKKQSHSIGLLMWSSQPMRRHSSRSLLIA